MNCASATPRYDVAIVQRAFELKPEEGTELLPIAHAFEEGHRGAHALRREVDGKVIGILLVGMREVRVTRTAAVTA